MIREKYIAILEEKGEGFNIMDSLEKVFIAEGLDKTDKRLYKRIIKYRDILNGKNPNPKSNSKWWIIGSAALTLVTAGTAIILTKHKKQDKEIVKSK